MRNGSFCHFCAHFFACALRAGMTRASLIRVQSSFTLSTGPKWAPRTGAPPSVPPPHVATRTNNGSRNITAVGVAAGSVAAVAVTAAVNGVMPCLAQPPSARTRAFIAADNKLACVVACLAALAAIAELQLSTAWAPRRLYRLHFAQHGSELINFTKSGLSSSQVSPYLAIDFGVGTRL